MSDTRRFFEAGTQVMNGITEASPGPLADPEPAHNETTVCRETLRQKMAEFERALVLQALKTARGNKAKAARILGITERIMGLRVEKYEIDAKTFRSLG